MLFPLLISFFGMGASAPAPAPPIISSIGKKRVVVIRNRRNVVVNNSGSCKNCCK